jgi:hypothetical protein
MGPTHYTKTEDDFIRANWQSLSDEELAEALNRPEAGVRVRRRKLGLARRRWDRKARLHGEGTGGCEGRCWQQRDTVEAERDDVRRVAIFKSLLRRTEERRKAALALLREAVDHRIDDAWLERARAVLAEAKSEECVPWGSEP